MSAQQSNQIGALLLRLALGVIFIAHSVYLKMIVFGLPGTAQFFTSIGLPAPLAYVVFAAEAAGGVALLLGAWTRLVALLLVPIAIGASWAHFDYGWLFENEGGGWEYPVFLAVALLVQALIGDGAWALKRTPPLAGGSIFASAAKGVTSPGQPGNAAA